MIVRPRPGFWELFYLIKGSVVPKVLPQILGVAAFSAFAVFIDRRFPQALPQSAASALTFFGIALSVFLGFRNNACYDRWWEGRRQWGQLIAETRSLVREIAAWIPDDGAIGSRLRRDLFHRLLLFPFGLVQRLRGDAVPAELIERLPPGDRPDWERSPDPCGLLLAAVSRDLAVAVREGLIPVVVHPVLADRVVALTAVQTACERLRNTPLPFTYALMLHRTAYLFCALLPLGIASALGAWTPLVTAIVAYTFFGLDELGHELEDPFGFENNDLPLAALARSAEIAVREALGEMPPPPAAPIDGLLR